MSPHFLFIYLLPGLLTWYVACSIAVSVELRKEAPFLATPLELKENVTIGQLLLCFLIGALPFINLAFAGAGLILIVINTIAWIFCRVCEFMDYMDFDEILEIQPFRKKNKKKYKDE